MIRKYPTSTRWRHLVAPVFVLAMVGSALLAVLHPIFLLVLVGILAAYWAISLGFSVLLASRHGWKYLFGLPVTFAVIHISWGLGFWWSWILFLLRGGREEVESGLTGLQDL